MAKYLQEGSARGALPASKGDSTMLNYVQDDDVDFAELKNSNDYKNTCVFESRQHPMILPQLLIRVTSFAILE